MYVLISETGPVRGGVMGVGGVSLQFEKLYRKQEQITQQLVKHIGYIYSEVWVNPPQFAFDIFGPNT